MHTKRKREVILLSFSLINILINNWRTTCLLALNIKHSNILMNRKHSHETNSQGYGQGSYKISYQVNSPYVELLESKKKVYGHRFDQKANRSFNNSGPSYIKASPASISSMFPQGSKSIKSSVRIESSDYYI